MSINKNPNIEFAIQSGRLVAATKSLVRFHNFENTRLTAERRLFNEELARSHDPTHKAELRHAIQENVIEQNALQQSWQNSSLRRKLTPAQAGESQPAIECRLMGQGTHDSLLAEPEIKRTDGQTKVKLRGYASVFNKNSVDLGGFVEQIAPGAFNKALETSDTRALINHDPNLLLGRQKNKSLRLYQNRHGLLFFVDLLSDDSLAQAVEARVKRGDWSGCSFAFIVEKDKWQLAKKPGDTDLRIVTEIRALWDISIVTQPAYIDTSVNVLYERKASDTGNDIASDNRIDWSDDDDDEFPRIENERLQRIRKVERGYLHCGRILNRCRAALS